MMNHLGLGNWRATGGDARRNLAFTLINFLAVTVSLIAFIIQVKRSFVVKVDNSLTLPPLNGTLEVSFCIYILEKISKGR